MSSIVGWTRRLPYVSRDHFASCECEFSWFSQMFFLLFDLYFHSLWISSRGTRSSSSKSLLNETGRLWLSRLQRVLSLVRPLSILRCWALLLTILMLSNRFLDLETGYSGNRLTLLLWFYIEFCNVWGLFDAEHLCGSKLWHTVHALCIHFP